MAKTWFVSIGRLRNYLTVCGWIGHLRSNEVWNGSWTHYTLPFFCLHGTGASLEEMMLLLISFLLFERFCKCTTAYGLFDRNHNMWSPFVPDVISDQGFYLFTLCKWVVWGLARAMSSELLQFAVIFVSGWFSTYFTDFRLNFLVSAYIFNLIQISHSTYKSA